ncbi:hypothetical protein LSTR_LSTR014317 [Laodelphax striatellus]|uniref:Uncharacterized protein n=1 Tax=Laodelphax striatellus TaxID=195883 RepID=A0A482WYL4_LAOST|nr:hypothetical protein LSTR_LSTR014317 [Laodelphax striatellus]
MPSLCYVVENVGYNKNLVMNANDEPKTAGDLGGKVGDLRFPASLKLLSHARQVLVHYTKGCVGQRTAFSFTQSSSISLDRNVMQKIPFIRDGKFYSTATATRSNWMEWPETFLESSQLSGRVQRSSERRNAGAKQASKPRHSFLPPPPLGELPGGLCLIFFFHSTNNSHRRCHLCLTVHAPASENCLPEI